MPSRRRGRCAALLSSGGNGLIDRRRSRQFVGHILDRRRGRQCVDHMLDRRGRLALGSTRPQRGGRNRRRSRVRRPRGGKRGCPDARSRRGTFRPSGRGRNHRDLGVRRELHLAACRPFRIDGVRGRRQRFHGWDGAPLGITGSRTHRSLRRQPSATPAEVDTRFSRGRPFTPIDRNVSRTRGASRPRVRAGTYGAVRVQQPGPQPVHVKPGSTSQLGEQPSPDAVLPSSHASSGPATPSPHSSGAASE